MPGISAELYAQIRETLLRCREFRSDGSLRAVFNVDLLWPFRLGLSEADNPAQRVDLCLDYVLEQRLPDGRPALPLFLTVLRDRYQEGDALRDDLSVLASKVQSALEHATRVITEGWVTQQFVGGVGPVAAFPVGAPSAFRNTRMEQLADNISQDMALLKEYEGALRLSSDPTERARCRREIERLKQSLAEQQREYELMGASPPLAEVGMHRSALDLAPLRDQLDQAFDDASLDAFCLSHFTEVYDRFGRGMRRDEKITLLLDYCRREVERTEKLSALLQDL